MITPSSEQLGLTRRQLFYGNGFMDAIVNGRHVVGHSGSSAGAANHLDTYPDLDWVVVLGNYDNSVAPIVETARQIIT
ncbi:hypothetical protein [Actinomadura alba]|uniref:Beta-lactamase n=1 Tax=Actinomadura alba TaxID=406431 RepID=A0ABR7LNU9_9ACTN|nr:hypothetical protein [Actinomadura alba]MBC6466506.1 hypothetical protein [Actinomadura alba]